MNLSTVKWAQWDKTQTTELLVLFICVCIALCTIVAHNIAQNRPDNFPSNPPDKRPPKIVYNATNENFHNISKITTKILYTTITNEFNKIITELKLKK